MKNELLAELRQNSEELFRVLPSFTPEQFNQVPFAGSWTAGQVASHLSMAETGVVSTLFGSSRPTTERAPDKNVAGLREAFLNFDIKMQAPDFTIPRADGYEQSALIAAFRRSREKLEEAIQTMDLSETATDFEFPTVGHMTRLELVNFAIVHAIRHTRQMKNIAAKISA
ncbi:DinB family protein [Chitinophaga sp.]|uniref:DinB family protein n=1 Tax=Chitinophaga sp. TaxID=1869181 RepID=UPI0031D121EB